jgi:hypothetical protein
MKRILFVLVTVSMVLGLIACGTTSTTTTTTTTTDTPSSDVPSWFLMPPVAEDAIYGMGSAKMKDVAKSREAAIARARADIAFQVNARVEAMIIDYYQEAGVDDNSQAIQFYETISKQITQIDLKNAVTKEVAMGKDGTVYAMVEFPKGQMLDEVGKVFERNEDAAFAEFKADQALKMLESDLENDPLKSDAGGK